jgi:hypothetical protein
MEVDPKNMSLEELVKLDKNKKATRGRPGSARGRGGRFRGDRREKDLGGERRGPGGPMRPRFSERREDKKERLMKPKRTINMISK